MSKVALDGMKDAIEAALRKELGPVGLDHIKLKEGFDHDGDGAVFVTAVLPLKAPLVPGEVSGAASVAVADILDSAGDDRFSYVYLYHPDDERPVDERAETFP